MSTDEFIGNKLKDFEFLTILGEGAFSSILKVQSLINQKIYALKMINLEKNKPYIEYIKSEIGMLNKLNHKNIVKYYTNFIEGNNIYIIMEYLEYGDLNDYINLLLDLNKKNNNIIEIKKGEIIHIFLQCIHALKFIEISNQKIFLYQKKKG